MALPPAFDGFVEHSKRVSPTCLITFERKRHIATAIGVQAIEHHRCKVRFYSTVELVNALEQEKALGKAGKLAEMLTKIDLVILDELG